MRKHVLMFTVLLGLVSVANSASGFRLSPASVEKEIKRGTEETLVLSRLKDLRQNPGRTIGPRVFLACQLH